MIEEIVAVRDIVKHFSHLFLLSRPFLFVGYDHLKQFGCNDTKETGLVFSNLKPKTQNSKLKTSVSGFLLFAIALWPGLAG